MDASVPAAGVAFASDPRQAFNGGFLPFVVVNDGGFADVSGIQADQTDLALISDHVLLHEFSHYLGRFTNRTFYVPSPVRNYDGFEHLPDEIAGSRASCILTIHRPYPFLLPGHKNISGTEKFETFDRVFYGLWNVP